MVAMAVRPSVTGRVHSVAGHDTITAIMDDASTTTMEDLPQEVIDLIRTEVRALPHPAMSYYSPFSRLARTSKAHASCVTKATTYMDPHRRGYTMCLNIPSVYRGSVREVVVTGSCYGGDHIDVSTLVDQLPLLVSLRLIGVVRNHATMPGWGLSIDYPGLGALSSLTRLECPNCNISNAMLAEFELLTALEVLDVSHNDRISDLSPLSKLTNLVVLNCGFLSRDVRSLLPLQALSASLRDLNIQAARTTATTALTALTALTRLDTLNAARWTTWRVSMGLACISGLTTLTCLDVSDNSMDAAEFSQLAGLTGLISLVCHGNKASIEPLSHLTGLLHLRCNIDETVGMLPLAPLSNLTSLDSLRSDADADDPPPPGFAPIVMGIPKLRRLRCPEGWVDPEMLATLKERRVQFIAQDPPSDDCTIS